MRLHISLALVSIMAVLSACAPAIPDSGAGIGFGTPEEFRAAQQARDAELERSILTESIQPPQVTGAPLSAIPGLNGAQTSGASTTAAVPVDGDAAIAGEAMAVLGVEPATAPAPAVPRPQGISDEQSFDAVAGRESIESDAARLAANRERFEVVQPTALPTRSSAGPNIVQYALQTTNQVGQPLYRRSALATQNRADRRCAEYASADQAQQDFLALGGPERDRRGIDPDGDGFACRWDPAPFRLAAR